MTDDDLDIALAEAICSLTVGHAALREWCKRGAPSSDQAGETVLSLLNDVDRLKALLEAALAHAADRGAAATAPLVTTGASD